MIFPVLLSMSHQSPRPELPFPKTYICYPAASPLKIDGRLNEPAWEKAPWTDDFEDIEGSTRPTPRFRTRAKMLWDANNLYIGAELEEPQIWGTLTVHDSVIFHDNDFEVFIDPDNDGCFYSEFEMNALNTTWDLLLPRSYRGGGPAIDGFELKGIQTAVHIDGGLNDPSHSSKKWTVEISIPWLAFKDIARFNRPPQDRDQWRINFSRVEWHVNVENQKFVKVPNTREDNWVWSPQGVVDMHRPEQWGILQFTTSAEGPVTSDPSPGFKERRLMVEAWEHQQAFRSQNGRWATSAEELGANIEGLKVYSSPHHFELEVGDYTMDDTLRFGKK